MPRRRKNSITIEPWPPLRSDGLYEGVIRSFYLDDASSALHVRIVNLDPEQGGRIHTVDLPLPVRPGNHTSEFLMACGLNATKVGTTLDLDKIVNRSVGLLPRHQTDDGSDLFDFVQMPQGPTAETAVPATGRSEVERSEKRHAGPDSETPGRKT